jgi:hypothetical protein
MALRAWCWIEQQGHASPIPDTADNCQVLYSCLSFLLVQLRSQFAQGSLVCVRLFTANHILMTLHIVHGVNWPYIAICLDCAGTPSALGQRHAAERCSRETKLDGNNNPDIDQGPCQQAAGEDTRYE